jgi:hypothetical protein
MKFVIIIGVRQIEHRERSPKRWFHVRNSLADHLFSTGANQLL